MSVQYSDTAVSHSTRQQQWGTEVLCDRVQHSTGVRLVKQQRLTGPVQQQTDPLGPPHHLQGHLVPCVAERVVPVVVGQHPGLTVVAQPGLVPRAFALQRGIADPDLEGTTLTYVQHAAVGSRGHRQGTQCVGPTVESCWVVRKGLAGFFVQEGQGAEVFGQREERAHCAPIKL